VILHKKNNNGLTLFEALCTLALLAMVMAALFGVLRLAVGGSERSHAILRRARIVSGIGRIMGRDFLAVCNWSEDKMPALHGAATSQNNGGARLAFFCTNTLAAEPEPSPSGLWRVEYLLETSERVPGCYDLFRRETPYTPGKPLDRSLSQTERLAAGLTTWRMRFSDGSEWHDEWQRNHLPQCARLELGLGSEEASDSEIEVFYFSPVVSVEAGAFP